MSSGVPRVGLVARLRAALDLVYREAIKFGTVGAVAFVTDVGLFNLLCTSLWPGTASRRSTVTRRPPS